MDLTRTGWLRALGGPEGGAVVAYGGGGLSAGAPQLTPVERALLQGVAGAGAPVVCLVPTAGGDGEALMERFRVLVSAAGGEPHVLSLFHRTPAPFSDLLDRADLVYVTGGAVANLAALWRLHGLGDELVRLWRRGVPVAGSSAGALIWSQGGVTTSFGAPRAWQDGLGLVPGSLCPHADTQPARSALYRELVEAGRLPPGWALDEAAAGVFAGGRLAGTLADDTGAAVRAVSPPR